MARPTLFVGLGGSGVKTVARLKHLLRRDWTGDSEGFARAYQFRFFDSDRSEFDDLKAGMPEAFANDARFIDLDREWVWLGDFNPQRAWQEVRNGPGAADLRTWLDTKEANTFPSEPLDRGLKAKRQLGRFAVWQNLESVRYSIEDAIKKLSSNDDGSVPSDEAKGGAIRFWVVTGSCGGTGSASFWDLLYVIAQEHRSKFAGADPDIRVVIWSPKPFIRILRAQRFPTELLERIQANAFAFFRELQYAIRVKESGEASDVDARRLFVKPSWRIGEHHKAAWRPFSSAFIVDEELEGSSGVTGGFLPFSLMPQILAEAVSLLSQPGPQGRLDSVLANPLAKETVPGSGSYPYWAAFGVKSVEPPGRLLSRFVGSRFAFDFIENRLLSPGGWRPQELRDLVRETVDKAVGSHFKRESAGRDRSGRFVDATRGRVLDDGGVLEELRSIDDFYRLAGDQAGNAEPDLDPQALTQPSIGGYVADLKARIEQAKAMVREDFAARFGTLAQVEAVDLEYGVIRGEFLDAMERSVSQWGFVAWAGSPDGTVQGVRELIQTDVSERLRKAKEALDKSNETIGKLVHKDADSLDALALRIVKKAEGMTGILGRFRESSGLRDALRAFAAKRAEWMQAAVDNALLMREIEVLSYVGAPQSAVVPESFFCDQVKGQVPLLERLRKDTDRLRVWISDASDIARTELKEIGADLLTAATSKVCTYFPPLEDVAELGAELPPPGCVSLSLLETLTAEVSKERDVFGAFLTSSQTKSVSLRDALGPSGGARLAGRFVEGASSWAVAKLRNEWSTHALEASLNSDKWPAKQIAAVTGVLAASKIHVLCPLGTSVKREEGADIRILSTSRVLAGLFGWQKDNNQNQLLERPGADEVVAVKLMSGLLLESAFPWIDEFRESYDRRIDYEPHLWFDGRVRVRSGGSENRVQRAFADALAWGILLSRDGWKTNPAFRRLFTKRLDNEEGAYFCHGPLLILDKVPMLLSRKLEESAVNGAGQIELRLSGRESDYVKVSEKDDLNGAYLAFLKSGIHQDNAEIFHAWCAGVEREWVSTRSEPDLKIVRHDRAQAYVDALDTTVLPAIRKKKKEIEDVPHQKPYQKSTQEVLGWVASHLEEERAAISAALLPDVI